MTPKKKSSATPIIYGICLLVVLFVALHSATVYEYVLFMVDRGEIEKSSQILTFLNLLSERLVSSPLEIVITSYTQNFLMWGGFGWLIVVLMIESGKKNYIHGKEFGTARWGTLSDIKDLFAENIMKEEIKRANQIKTKLGRWKVRSNLYKECEKDGKLLEKAKLEALQDQESIRKQNGSYNKKLHAEEVKRISSIFSSMFSTRDSHMDYDVREYLNTIVPGLSADFQQDLANQMQASQSTYNIVRFYANTGSGEVVEPTLAGVQSVFPTIDEILNMIQPIFNAVVLMEYELEPTEAEAQALTEEIFSKLFTVTTATSIEYCGQDIRTGEGTPNAAHSCGSIHALSDCPNPVTGTHSSYTCGDCCYYYCPGHDYTCSDPDCSGHTSYCGGCVHDCNGYTYCGSHSVIAYTLSVDGIYRLEAEYFLDPIEQLSNIPSRTEDEEAKLQELKDYHEIFLEMMSQVSINYGGGMTMADLSGVVFIDGTRNSCQAVIDLALSQVGQIGGQPYWSYYGFSSRVEWCACFVHWCMRNTPSASGSYPQTSNNAYCQTIANNFMAIGQWGNRGYTDLVAGDTIFFDWQGDGHTDHIGLVIGTDGTNVYTVEGNSGDAVKVKSYPINSSVIYGYGLMNY